VTAQRPQHEQAAPDLHQHIGCGETPATRSERVRDRDRKHKARKHEREQSEADGRGLRIKPIGEPGGEDPHPPDRHQHQSGPQYARDTEMLEQVMRKLGDRENEDKVEEQFDESDLVVLVRGAAAEKIAACAKNHASAGINGKSKKPPDGRRLLKSSGF
jgi:hypothetical protein